MFVDPPILLLVFYFCLIIFLRRAAIDAHYEYVKSSGCNSKTSHCRCICVVDLRTPICVYQYRAKGKSRAGCNTVESLCASFLSSCIQGHPYIYKGWTCFWSTSVPNVTCLSSWFIAVKMSKYRVKVTSHRLLVLYITQEYYGHRIWTSFPGLLSYNAISEGTGEGLRCRSCLKNRAPCWCWWL